MKSKFKTTLLSLITALSINSQVNAETIEIGDFEIEYDLIQKQNLPETVVYCTRSFRYLGTNPQKYHFKTLTGTFKDCYGNLGTALIDGKKPSGVENFKINWGLRNFYNKNKKDFPRLHAQNSSHKFALAKK